MTQHDHPDDETLPADPEDTLDAQPALRETLSETATDATLDAPSDRNIATDETFAPDATLPGNDAAIALLGSVPHADDDENLSRLPTTWTFTAEPPGRYDDLHREMGRGGIGRVFLAFDRHLQRRIAVKELLHTRATGHSGSSLRERSPSEQRFVREAWVTGQLQHPSIVPVYELGQRDDGTLYYTMKVVCGHTLADTMLDATTREDRLALLGNILDVCQAIAYAHSRGVIHRDLKPGNVMLGEFGETVVLDWGLAKVHGHDDIRGEELAAVTDALSRGELGTTIAGAPLGTPAYMSPEQAQGDTTHIDTRTDVWSLGVLLFELLAHRLPFHGDTPRQLILALLDNPPPPLLEVAPDTPTDLAAIVDKALAPLPQRYTDAGALARDLKAFLDGRRVSAYSYSSLELVRRFIARNRALSATILALFLLSIIGTITIALAWQDAADARDEEAQARQLAERNQALEAEARQSAEDARALAEERDRESKRRLSHAYAERAHQLLGERNLLRARIFTAAALIHSGAHPLGAFADTDALDGPEVSPGRRHLLRHRRGPERHLDPHQRPLHHPRAPTRHREHPHRAHRRRRAHPHPAAHARREPRRRHPAARQRALAQTTRAELRRMTLKAQRLRSQEPRPPARGA